MIYCFVTPDTVGIKNSELRLLYQWFVFFFPWKPDNISGFFPCTSSSNNVQVCVRWCRLRACVPDLNPSVTETTVHPRLSSESSTATRRLLLIRSPSPLSSRPHHTTLHPWTAGGAAAGRRGHQTSHPAFSPAYPSFKIHMAHSDCSSPWTNLSRTPDTCHQHHSSSWLQHRSHYSV